MKYVKLLAHSPQLTVRKSFISLNKTKICHGYFLHFSNILCINWSPGLQEVELLHVVVPQHGGGQLGVEVSVVPGAAHYLVLGVDCEHNTAFSFNNICQKYDI